MSDPCASEYNPTMYRWQVTDMYDRSTGNLAKSLADAGALCRAFDLGVTLDPWWYPGCGREAPR